MAKKVKPKKPKKRPGESRKEYKARKKAWKQEQDLIRKYQKAGIDDPEFFAQQRGERPAPPPPHERPIPAPKTREEGGQRHDGTYVRRSTVDLEKIEAHLDTRIETDRGESLHERFKTEFGEDLSTPDGYELIPERDVLARTGPPTLASTEGGLSPEVLADVYGPEGAPTVPVTAPPPAPEVMETAPDAELEPEPVVELEPEPVVEMEPEPAGEVEAGEVEEGEPSPEPTPEPTPEPEQPTVQVPEPGQVAGVAGAVPGAAVSAATPEKPEEEIEPPKYPFFHLGRFIKLGRRAWLKGGPLAKTIVGVINFFLYLALVIPPIIIIPIVATVYDWNKKRKEKQAEWDAYVDEHGYPPEEEGYAEGYYGEEYAAQGYDEGQYEGGYYEGDGYRDEDRYAY